MEKDYIVNIGYGRETVAVKAINARAALGEIISKGERQPEYSRSEYNGHYSAWCIRQEWRQSGTDGLMQLQTADYAHAAIDKAEYDEFYGEAA